MKTGATTYRRDRALLFAGVMVGVIVLLAVSAPVCTAATGSVVNFPDDGLRAAIRAAIHKPNGDIYDTDLVGLTNLTADDRGIVNLEGIQHCVDLAILYLADNQIIDINPLGSLTNLTKLSLSINQISNISALSTLTNLEDLYLANNHIIDISALSALSSLKDLDLSRNLVVDVSPLSGLIALTRLIMHYNCVADLSPLSGLINLATLYMNGNEFIDIGPLSGLTSLTSLLVSLNAIIDISPLSGLTNLLGLGLQHTKVVDINVLSGLTNLTWLALSGCQLGDISVLSNLTNLQFLRLDATQITDISPLAGLINLEGWLYLNSNAIIDISALSNLIKLTELYLHNNQIVEIDSLADLTNLTELNLENNQIADISTLVGNVGLAAGDEVHVNYNCLDLAAGSDDVADIQTLLDRGVDLAYEPQRTSIPAAPSSLTAAATAGGQINVSWTDNSYSEMGFEIERKLEGGEYSLITTVGANVESYSDSGLETSTTYCYRVRAYNCVGASDYSNEDCAAASVVAPTANFSYAPECVVLGESVVFTDLSTDDGAIVSWAWQFGDNNASITQHPTHLYQEAGTVTVSLTVTDNSGLTDSVSEPIHVYLRGDLDGNDGLDIADVLMLYRFVYGVIELDACQQTRADIDQDGDIDEDDAQALVDIVFGI